MNLRKYYWLSILSGCVWAGIAYVLSFGAFSSLIIGGAVAAPFIGLLIGLLYHPAYRLSRTKQIFLSLLTLYLAAALFGLAVGLYDAFGRTIPNRTGTIEIILQAMFGTLWGLTFTGYVILLWPLAYFNHKVMGRASVLPNNGMHPTPHHGASHAS